jgi:type I restriction enzyme M protein
LQKTQKDSDNSWSINIKDIEQNTFDLSAKNPNTPKETPLRSPEEILKNMAELDKKSEYILKTIKELL